jgi:hypothetical protein
MLIETYGFIVKKSEFLSYSAKNRIQNGGHMQGFWFSELQLQKKEYHIRNQHKKLHETVYSIFKIHVIFWPDFVYTHSHSKISMLLSPFGPFFMQKYVHNILKTIFLKVTQRALSNHTEKNTKNFYPSFELPAP